MPTKGNPRPALAQLTDANFCFSASATGETKCDGGKRGVLHVGQVYSDGAVVFGIFWPMSSMQAQ